MKTNYHTHHYLCGHAKGNVEDYVLEAIKHGFTEIGISDHGPINAIAFPRMSIDEFNNVYLKELEEAILKYSENIKIYKALEIEFIEDDIDYYKELLKSVDYLILGCHYYMGLRDITSYSVYGLNSHEKLECYTKLIEKALDTKLFKIIAHPDLFIHGYGQLDEFAVRCVKRILDAVIRNDVLIEFNAGGIRGNKRFDESGNPKYAVPNNEFWKVVETTNAKVIINSDCHTPEELNDEAFQKAHQLARTYTLNIVNTINE